MTRLKPQELLDLRQKYDIPRTRLARYYDMDYSTFYRWETGRHTPPVYVTALYLYYLNHFGYLKEDTTEWRRQDVETAH